MTWYSLLKREVKNGVAMRNGEMMKRGRGREGCVMN